jgi:hypothetical protein
MSTDDPATPDIDQMGEEPSGHEVGTAGEAFIERLWQLPFGRDFLFANPKYKKGRNEREVCDLLLLLDGYAVVVQIKTAERASKSGWDEQRWADWGNAKTGEALKQLKGGLRAMLDGRASAVENDRQGRVEIDPARLTHLFGIVVVDGPALDHWGTHPVVEVGGRSVPVLLTSHQNMIEIVTELSTPMDLVDYLGAHARFFEKNKLLGASELDLLAFYKRDPEEFLASLDEHTTIILESGLWETFAQQEARHKRSEWDGPSRIIDAMIDKLHEARFAELEEMKLWNKQRGSNGPQKDGAERAIASLARMRRMDRRLAGQKVIEKSQKCLQQERNRHFAVLSPDPDDDFRVFLISSEVRMSRVQWLEFLCVAGLLAYERSRVIGYATEPVMGELGFSIDSIIIEMSPERIRKTFPAEMLELMQQQFRPGMPSNETEFGGPEAPSTTTQLDPGDRPATFS